jgi:hypothetical protein
LKGYNHAPHIDNTTLTQTPSATQVLSQETIEMFTKAYKATAKGTMTIDNNRDEQDTSLNGRPQDASQDLRIFRGNDANTITLNTNLKDMRYVNFNLLTGKADAGEIDNNLQIKPLTPQQTQALNTLVKTQQLNKDPIIPATDVYVEPFQSELEMFKDSDRDSRERVRTGGFQ